MFFNSSFMKCLRTIKTYDEMCFLCYPVPRKIDGNTPERGLFLDYIFILISSQSQFSFVLM
jgi:hypothetical protein